MSDKERLEKLKEAASDVIVDWKSHNRLFYANIRPGLIKQKIEWFSLSRLEKALAESEKK